MSIGIDFGIGIDQNSWYRTGIVSKPKKLVSPITKKRTSLPLIGELCLIKNHRHNYGQYLTTPSRTHSNNYFASFYSAILNISIVGENSVYAHA